jgi:hypothetical protein
MYVLVCVDDLLCIVDDAMLGAMDHGILNLNAKRFSISMVIRV